MRFYKSIYKSELFLFFQNSRFSTIYARHIYDLLFTNMNIFQWRQWGRNILVNSQLERILFVSSDKKKWNKTEKDTKNIEKENNSNESETSVKMRYQI